MNFIFQDVLDHFHEFYPSDDIPMVNFQQFHQLVVIICPNFLLYLFKEQFLITG